MKKTDDEEIIMPSFASGKAFIQYEDIGKKVKNLFDFLHEEKTRKWIAKTIELGVSWDRIFIFCASVWSYPEDIEKIINVVDDGRALEIQNMADSEKTCITLEPIKLEGGTKLRPQITLVLCGSEKKGVSNFYGKYFKSHPWFTPSIEKILCEQNNDDNNKQPLSESSKKKMVPYSF